MHPNYVNGDLDKLDGELKEFKSAGAETCELVLQGLDVIIGTRVIESRQDALINILRKHDLDYTMHMPHGLNLLDTEMLDIYLEIFRSSIAFAKAAGIKLINYHAGVIRRKRDEKPTAEGETKPEGESKPDPATLIQNEAEQIKLLAASAPDITLCMENALFGDNKEQEDFSAAVDTSSMIDFYNKVDMPNFKLTFDIGHRHLALDGNNDALLADMEKLLPYIGHIHLHDNCGYRKEMREAFGGQRLVVGAGDIHLPLGWGTVPIKESLSLLKNYKGIINLEIEHRFSYHYSDAVSIVREYLAQ